MAYSEKLANTKGRKVQSVDRAICILETLAGQPRGLSLSELGGLVGLHASTAYRLLATLHSHNLVSQNPKTKVYCLGSALIRIGELARTQNDIVSVATDLMNSMAEQTGELVNLAILEHHQAVYLAQVQGNPRTAVSLFTQIGAHVPLYCTGVGKAMLAGLPDEVLKEIVNNGLVQMTHNTITDEKALRAELMLTRERDYAIDHEENADGVCCVASAIWSATDEIAGAISISGPVARVNSSNFESLARLVCENAAKVSQMMGHVS